MTTRTRPQRKFRPRLEELEARLVPDATTFVQNLYVDVLGRPGSADEVSAQVQAMANGASESTVAAAFVNSAEHRALQVNAYYQDFFNRTADSSGLSNWVSALQSGTSETTVQDQLLASPEYSATHATNQAFVDGLYQDLLNRAADPSGEANFAAQLQSGDSRAAVADAVLTSPECQAQTVAAQFTALLGRPADAQSLASAATALQNGASLDSVALGVLTSAEYHQRAQTAPVLPGSQPGGATGTTGSTTGSTSGATPALTEGPFFEEFSDAALNRSDLTTGTTRASVVNGTPLTLTLNISQLTGGTAVSGARVDLWEADASGAYSDEAADGTTGQTWLRGYQFTDGNGSVTFTTIIPGWYPGRTPHIHVKVRTYDSSGAVTSEFTTQLFFDPATISAVYANAPYNTRGTPDTTNATDGIYNTKTADGTTAGSHLTLSLSPAASGNGYVGTFNVILA
jgi:protocatechuate 3,4-dioxygenase beta subunit